MQLRNLIFVAILGLLFTNDLRSQVISTFPHYENLESWTLCTDTCGGTCVLSNGWSNQGSIDFIVDTAGTATTSTGPDIDHNPGTSTGKYVYVESSSPCNPDTALIETPFVDLNNVVNPTFTFWYHQLSANATVGDTFDVLVSTDSGSTWNPLQTGPDNDTSSQWQFDSINLSAFTGNIIKLRIQYITANSFNDFALDDFTFGGLQLIDAGVDSVFSSSGFCAGDSSQICITVANAGLLPIDSLTIYATINGAGFNSPFVFENDTLAPGEDTILCIGTTQLNTNDTIIVYTTMPNGLNDTFNLNDTFQLLVQINPIPDIDAGTDTTVCGLTAFPLGGNPTSAAASTFQWSTAAFIDDSTAANPQAFFTQSGVFTYYLQVTDSNLCTNTDTLNVTVLDIPSIDAGPDDTICPGDSVVLGGSPTAPDSSTVLWSNGLFLNFDTIENPIASVTINTQFELAVTDSNNCVFTDTVILYVFFNPALEPGDSTSVCLGDSVQLGGTPIALNYDSILWSPAAGLSSVTAPNPMASPPADTTYYIVLIDTFGCTYQDSVFVDVNIPPSADAGPDTTVCAFAAFPVGGTPTGPPTATYNWSPGALFNDSTLANPMATVSQDTLLVVEVTDTATGCTTFDTVAITIYAIPFADAGLDTVSLCQGDSLVLGGSPTAPAGASVAWSPSLYFNDTTLFNPTIYGITIDFVYLTVTEPLNGCQNFDTTLVLVNNLPDVDAGADAVICFGDSLVIGGSPTSNTGVSFLWSPAALLDDDTLPNPVAAPTQDTTFFLTVTSVNGCNSYDSVFVQVNPLPIAVITPPVQVCLGDTTQLQVSGGVSYAWDYGVYLSDDTIANPLAFPPANTLFTVTITDTNGCQDTAQSNVVFYPLPPVSAGPDDTICDGNSTTLAASGAISYQWSPATGLSDPNVASPTATPLVTTDYTVVGTDANNCSFADTMTVFVNVLPAADAGPDEEVCLNSTVQLGGSPTGPAGSTYSWNSANLDNPAIANPTYIPSAVGVFVLQVEVTDINGCSSTDDVQVTVHDLPIPVITPVTTTICVGDTIGLSASGGNQYLWSPAASLVNANTATPGAYPVVTTLYTVTVTDGNSCTATEDVTVPVFPPTPAFAGNDTGICQQDTIQLLATGGVSYQWAASPYLTGISTATPTCFTPITNTFTVTVTDANGCTASDAVTVTVYPLPTVSAGPDKRICLGQSTPIGGAPTGPAGSQYSWTPGASLNNALIANPSASPAVSTTYKVIVTSNRGCVDSASMTVTVDSLPVVAVVTAPDSICIGDTAFAEVTTGAWVYEWTPAATVVEGSAASALFVPLQTTEYTVLVRDGRGCESELDVTVKVNPLPTPDAGISTQICEGDTTQLVAKGGVLYAWSNDTTLSNPDARITLAFPSATTSYTVTATDANGCTNTDSVVVIVNARPFINAGEDVANCEINAVHLGGEPSGPEDAVYTWTPEDGLSDPHDPNPLLVSPERSVYTLMVQDVNGCTSTDSVLVNADCFALIYAPSAFTPGANGINDEFKLVHYRITEPHLRIYNRWGDLVFETKDLDIGWDGKVQGQPEIVQYGIYFWQLTYKSEEKKKLSKEGTVTLVR